MITVKGFFITGEIDMIAFIDLARIIGRKSICKENSFLTLFVFY